MASPFVLQSEFLGMWQDSPRDNLPTGKLWNCLDAIPSYLGAPLRGRGLTGTYYTLGLTNRNILTVFAGTLATGGVNLATASNGNTYISTGSSLGSGAGTAQNPVLHRTAATPLVVFPGSTPKSYDGTTFQSLAGSPPGGVYADVWNDRTLLASSSALPQRLWFGPVGDAAGTWDTTNSWLDTRLPILGVAAIRTGIMLFHTNYTGLVTGTTPPSATTIGDLAVRSPAFSVGCMSAFTVAKYNDTVIWADQRGIYQSDGNTVRDLTAIGGISSYWRALGPYFPGYSGGIVAGITYTVAAGIIHDTYVINITRYVSGVGNPVVTSMNTLCYDLLRGFWYRMTGPAATSFTRDPNMTPEELVYGVASYGAGVVGSMSGVFNPDAGTYGSVTYETGFFRGFSHYHRKWVPSYGLQSWRRAYLDYELRDTAAAGQIALGYAVDLASSSYTAINPVFGSTTTTTYKRQHRDIHQQGNAIAFQVQATADTDIRLNALEIEYSPLEGSRLAQ